ncbi:MAG: glutathione peroxidase [Alphaproteobacteria bacterium]
MTTQDSAAAKTLHDFSIPGLMGGTIRMSDFRGRPVLLVNTATQCGFTPQLHALEALWQEQQAKGGGVQIIGVPSADFGNQEYDQADKTSQVCTINYGVTFPLAAKQAVKRKSGQSDLYDWASSQAGWLGHPRWNFHKFLFDGDGNLVDWFAPFTKPDSKKLQAALDAVSS